MRHKTLAKLLGTTLALALVLAACGGGDKSSSSKTKKSTTTSAGGGGGGGAKTPASGPGFDGSTIKLGVVTPISGSRGSLVNQYIGGPLTSGNKTYWDGVNETGGVAGKYKVELSQEDSQYDPTVGGSAYDKLKNDVVAFQQILGTQILQSIQPRLVTDKITASPATLDAEWALDPNLMPVATSYQLLAINGLDYFMNKADGKGKNVCVIAQDDSYGEAGVQGAEAAAKALKFKIKTTQRFALLADKTAAVQGLKDNDCEAVLVAALFADVPAVVTTARQIGFEARLIALAPAWDEEFLIGSAVDAANRDFLVKNLWVMSTGPQWGDTSVPGMAKMITDIEKYEPDTSPSPYFAYGYAQAWAMHQVLEVAVKNGDLSREGLLNALNEVGILKFEGLIADFDYGTGVPRQTPAVATVFEVDPEVNGGLKGLEVDYSSKAAKAYKVTK